MPELPVVSGKEAIRAFESFGYEQARQKGSHVFMRCPGRPSISVPLHDPLKRGTLRNLIRHTGLSVEEFRDAL
ncbi:MAG: type II toxin-antitoxin system HicA family toxin [Actinobacteria bacterium]|nr:type II toxin-antitoxin system HicA family toxin [Actinomycetota bacterium]